MQDGKHIGLPIIPETMGNGIVDDKGLRGLHWDGLSEIQWARGLMLLNGLQILM